LAFAEDLEQTASPFEEEPMQPFAEAEDDEFAPSYHLL
jgi:hypothetical protein